VDKSVDNVYNFIAKPLEYSKKVKENVCFVEIYVEKMRVIHKNAISNLFIKIID
jgi:hypothetical protein